jgi:hypothetical protein
MKKLIIVSFCALFGLSTSVLANPITGGMLGIKIGTGDLEGTSKTYTAGTTTYANTTGSKDADFGAIFAELNIMDSPISVGIEHVPFDADISLNGAQSGVSANVGEHTTFYLLAMRDLNAFSIYAKAGLSTADIGAIKHGSPDGTTTINSQSNSLDGTMLGVGVQSPELPFGLVGRLEYTLTEFDDINVVTTSLGSTSVKKSADGELETLTFSLAKEF